MVYTPAHLSRGVGIYVQDVSLPHGKFWSDHVGPQCENSRGSQLRTLHMGNHAVPHVGNNTQHREEPRCQHVLF